MDFKDKFYFLLESDILDMGLKPACNPHHRVAIRGIDRKNPNQIPDIHKVSGDTSERKILMIKNNGGQCPCNNNDMQYIIKKYNISNISPSKPRMLGKTGVFVIQTPQGNFMLKK